MVELSEGLLESLLVDQMIEAKLYEDIVWLVSRRHLFESEAGRLLAMR